MSITLIIRNHQEDRPATNEEIGALFLNCHLDGSGRADIDIDQGKNKCALDGGWKYEIRLEATE